MYFPYVRGRQYELLALRELVVKNILSDKIIPIVEPVKLSPTLVNLIKSFIEAPRRISIIHNPSVGTFASDFKNVQDHTKEADYKQRFVEYCKNDLTIKSIILQNEAIDLLDSWLKTGIKESELLVISTIRDSLGLYDSRFSVNTPQFVLTPNNSVFKRRIRDVKKILLEDNFEKKERNSDYLENSDEFFSDDHLYYKEDGFFGFSDYSIVGNEYLEAGFAPYAVAIHIVYFTLDKTLRIRHFVSNSNDDISNPALKYYEALSKLVDWHDINKNDIELTLGLDTFLQHHKQQTYPGLGTVKKLSLMHHIELMGNFLKEVN